MIHLPRSNSSRALTPIDSGVELTVVETDLERTLTYWKRRREHIVLDPDLMYRMGIERRANLRLTLPDGRFVAVTVENVQKQDDTLTAGIGSPEGIDRLGGGVTFPFTAQLHTGPLPHPTYTPAEAEAAGELIERLVDGGGSDILVMSPHGGDIEIYTYDQGVQFQDRLSDLDCVFWGCQGWSNHPDQSAYDRWHITSVDVNPKSYPLLQSVADRSYAYAVAFHGHVGDAVELGGRAPEAFKNDIIAAIEAVLPPEIEVKITENPDIAGDSDRNILQRMSDGNDHTIQIEQPWIVRRDYGTAVAHAVADVYRTLLEP